MSLASWVCVGFAIALIVVIGIANWYADRYRDERKENERLRGLLEILGCPEYPIMRLVPLRNERARKG